MSFGEGEKFVREFELIFYFYFVENNRLKKRRVEKQIERAIGKHVFNKLKSSLLMLHNHLAHN